MGDNSRPRASVSPKNSWQRSSGVEQRTHKPFVGGSNPPAATIILKAPIPFFGVGAFFLVDDAEAESPGGRGIGPFGCFGEPCGVFRSLGELGDGARNEPRNGEQ